MPNIIIDWIIMTIAVLIASYIIPGVMLSGFLSALLVAVVIGILNAFIRPLLLFITLPINILTLGLFTLVINAVLIMIASAITPGFAVSGFFSALMFSIILTIVLYLIHAVEYEVNISNRGDRI